MPGARKLKVFRTAIGFHDAYVAAPSRKAALAAWGAEKDLFAIGSAEQVTDPGLMKQALDKPGEVVRLSRGSMADHLRVAGRNAPKARKTRDPEDKPALEPKPRPKPKPPPSRHRVEEVERELSEFEAAAETELAALRKREVALARERAAIEARLDRARDRIEKRLAQARADHERALERWRDAP